MTSTHGRPPRDGLSFLIFVLCYFSHFYQYSSFFSFFKNLFQLFFDSVSIFVRSFKNNPNLFLNLFVICRSINMRDSFLLLFLLKSPKTHTQLLELACCQASARAKHSAINHAKGSEARTCRSECDNASRLVFFFFP